MTRSKCCHETKSGTVCARCRAWDAKKAREAKKRRTVKGTAPCIGLKAFLAALATPDGFERRAIVDTWPGGKSFDGVEFVGDGGATTVRIVLRERDQEWSVGDGHTSFTTARGSFSFDRAGVEDSFYVNCEDTAEAVDAKVREQIEKARATRVRHESSETVPVVGHVVTPEKKAEIAATLKSGRAYEFRPSGFGIGYRVSTSKRACGYWAQAAPRALAAFFGTGPLYYATLDCD